MEQLLLDIQTKMQENPAEGFLPLSNSFEAHRIAISSLFSDFAGCLIMGPVGSGKSHLLKVCKQHLEDVVREEEILYFDSVNDLPEQQNHIKYLLIDNITKLTSDNQENLFHWFNHLKTINGKMILVLDSSVDELVTLKDLKSRLMTLQQAKLNHPNEKDLEIFILKQAFNYQLQLEEDVLNYLGLRVERDFAKITELMKKLDEESLREHRKITIPFIKKII
ncbi:MAG: hypothetical protein GY793_05700 [Proteobacteria bacterium]|nr:hypothetical protein [Pseudomonadota bacterium]